MSDGFGSTEPKRPANTLDALGMILETAFAEFQGQDLNASTQTLDFTGGDDTAPNGAEAVTVLCAPSGDASVEVIFYDEAQKSNEIGRVTDAQQSALSSTGGTNIHTTVDLASPHVEVDFIDDSGAGNTASGSAYVR